MTVLAFISTALATQVAIFGCVAALMWAVFDWLSKGNSRAAERLNEIREPRSRAGDKPGGANKVTQMLEQSAPTLAAPLQPKTEQEMGKLKERLQHAGFRSESAQSIFLGFKFILLVVGFFAAGGSLALLRGFDQQTGMITIAVAGLMFYVPDVVVWFCKKSRQDNIFFGLPDALDLMVVCVEAGLGLDQAMRKVSEEMKKSYGVLADEFALCNLQLQMGSPRNDVLHELGARTGVDDLKALAAILIQADKFGSSVAQALRVQSDSMRTRRSQMAEEKAAKTAVKLIFPLVIFIFPAIFVVLVGPAAITMINEMFPAMAGE
ncbi:MAG: type II secretion system F family protein [Planctomycetota bacterium]